MTQTGATQAQDFDQAWVEEFAGRWEAAWNSHEPEQLLVLMTDDIVYDDTRISTSIATGGCAGSGSCST
jgi:hypothetical protein